MPRSGPSWSSAGAATLQGELWSAAAADWADLQEPQHAPVWAAMLDAAGVGLGTRLLDVGCGAGGAGLLAAGRGAVVCGLDAAPGLIAVAARRGPALARPALDFHVGAQERLAYRDGAFDVALAADAIPFSADPQAALTELRRVLAPGGCAVVAVWGRPEDCDQADIVEALRGLAPGLPDPFAFAPAGVLDRMMTAAHLHPKDWCDVACPFAYPDIATAWQAQRSAGPVQAAIRAAGEPRVRDAILAALSPHSDGLGRVRMDNRFRVALAKPD
jgi:SAM-dependent methyltransferase